MQQNTSSLPFARFASVPRAFGENAVDLWQVYRIGCLRGRKAREEEYKERLQGRYGLFHFHIYQRDVKIINTLTSSNTWLDVHSCVIFAYIISRRDGDNNSALAGVPLLPTLPKIPVPFPFRIPDTLAAELESE